MLQELTGSDVSTSPLSLVGTADDAGQRPSDFSSPNRPAPRHFATAESSSPALLLQCGTGSAVSACVATRMSSRLQARRQRPGSSDSKCSSPSAEPATPTSATSVDSSMLLCNGEPDGSPPCGSRGTRKRMASNALRGANYGRARRAHGSGHACVECGCVQTPVWCGSMMPAPLGSQRNSKCRNLNFSGAHRRAGPHGPHSLCNACGVRLQFNIGAPPSCQSMLGMICHDAVSL